jgi:hypothetical protein
LYTADGIATAGQYDNLGSVDATFTDDEGNSETAEAEDPSSYFGADPAIAIDKMFVGIFADNDGNGLVTEGDVLEYKFNVTTGDGNVPISNVDVTDPLITSITYVSGDDSNFDILDLNETWMYQGFYTVTDVDDAATFIENTATATGDFTDDAGNTEMVEDMDTEIVDVFQKNQRSIQIRDIWGVDVANGATEGTSYSPTSGSRNSNLIFNQPTNAIEGAFSITDESEGGNNRALLVQLQGLDVDIEYDADPGTGKNDVDWQLLNLSGSTLQIWADSDVDPLTGMDLGGIDYDLGTDTDYPNALNANPELENTLKLGVPAGEGFDFEPIAINFQEDINVLFKFSLGSAALTQLGGSLDAGDSFRVTAEAFIGGRNETNNDPVAFYYTENFTV